MQLGVRSLIREWSAGSARFPLTQWNYETETKTVCNQRFQHLPQIYHHFLPSHWVSCYGKWLHPFSQIVTTALVFKKPAKWRKIISSTMFIILPYLESFVFVNEVLIALWMNFNWLRRICYKNSALYGNKIHRAQENSHEKTKQEFGCFSIEIYQGLVRYYANII